MEKLSTYKARIVLPDGRLVISLIPLCVLFLVPIWEVTYGASSSPELSQGFPLDSLILLLLWKSDKVSCKIIPPQTLSLSDRITPKSSFDQSVTVQPCSMGL